MVLKDRFPNAVRFGRLVVSMAGLLIAVGASPHAAAPGNWPRLQVPDPVGSHIARTALDMAWERLARTDCAEILNTFMDRSGHPLDERLRTLAVDRQTYLTLIFFVDGSREVPCIKGSFAFTTPGNRVVRICVEEFKRTWQNNPENVVSRIIHEMLHTLGLGEDPPSSAEITRRVDASCSAEQRNRYRNDYNEAVSNIF